MPHQRPYAMLNMHKKPSLSILFIYARNINEETDLSQFGLELGVRTHSLSVLDQEEGCRGECHCDES